MTAFEMTPVLVVALGLVASPVRVGEPPQRPTIGDQTTLVAQTSQARAPANHLAFDGGCRRYYRYRRYYAYPGYFPYNGGCLYDWDYGPSHYGWGRYYLPYYCGPYWDYAPHYAWPYPGYCFGF